MKVHRIADATVWPYFPVRQCQSLAVVTAGLLAWKRAISTFTVHLTEEELRSAILLAVLALVIYPALPTGTVGPYDLLNPRAGWDRGGSTLSAWLAGSSPPPVRWH